MQERKKNSFSEDDSKGGEFTSPSEYDEEPDDGAIPLDMFEAVKIKGYELTSFDAECVPPPAQPLSQLLSSDNTESEEGVPVAVQEPQRTKLVIAETDARVTEEQAREALMSYLSNHCCYGKGAAKNMVVKRLEYTPAYHYELQTFSEKRETAWTYSPVRQNYFDGGGIGSPPLPWEIEELPSQAFKDEVRLVAIPNTSSVKTCHRCRGTGGVTCRDCNGKGWSRCINCHGDGWISDSGGFKERCFYCQHSKHGHGQQDCGKCNTKGKVNCATCEGQGQIKCYIQLSITWKVHTAEHIVERLNLPHDLIRDVSGQVAFEEESPQIKPLHAQSNEDISTASNNIVSNHLNSYSNDQKIVRQRHQIRIVPVTHVFYEWKGREHSFYVYGYENKVFMKKYPQKCCWGCNIL